MSSRLTTAFRVAAAVRQGNGMAIPVVVVRRGSEEAGALFVKLNRRDLGCTVLVEARDTGGEMIWLRGTGELPVAEPEADAYVERQVKRDPDAWVVEIEDRQGRHLFAGRLV